ncbi:hypothetical protein T09_6836 [Trichinella sp. T9]|uniref:Uncharacterized protein n=1 Tax=Trichinella murrelli TaxID=144512 RepID=A0A0V0U511_9BILA|nr:hypothetical protein T05_3909 [Trichinella murrelli]KRX63095.1 hypothetical protein T09_6836 [Trichinella sp. T9]
MLRVEFSLMKQPSTSKQPEFANATSPDNSIPLFLSFYLAYRCKLSGKMKVANFSWCKMVQCAA